MPAINATQYVSVKTTTSDGTIATGATYRTKAGFAYLVNVKAVNTDGVIMAAYERIGAFMHSAAGTLTLVGSVTSVHTAESNAAPGDCTMDADDSNKDIRVRITGDPGRTLRWNIYAEVVPTPTP